MSIDWTELETGNFPVIIDQKKTWCRYEVCFTSASEEKQIEWLKAGFSPALPLFVPEEPEIVYLCECDMAFRSWNCNFGLARPINWNSFDYGDSPWGNEVE